MTLHPSFAAISSLKKTKPLSSNYSLNCDSDPICQQFESLKPLAEIISHASPYLSTLWQNETEFLQKFFQNEIRESIRTTIESLKNFASSNLLDSSQDQLCKTLRRHKQQLALSVAIADIAAIASLSEITQALSDFADAACSLAAEFICQNLVAKARTEHENYLVKNGDSNGDSGDGLAANSVQKTSTAPISATSGLIILGMGKLGANELNYSSDIDLIILFEPKRVPAILTADGVKRSLGENYNRVARDLVQILSAVTEDGFVFRTDLRLRPDPSSTPPAISTTAAEIYYESLGQNWERAAMIKARPIAADVTAANDFLQRLRPFIWRKHLDYASLKDIQSIKLQINAKIGTQTNDENFGARSYQVLTSGHNVKLGNGGIREIEFFAQTQQLIWGGRIRELRQKGTVDALNALAKQQLITIKTAEELIDAYGYLRRVEHRLQMVADAQTHSLPSDAAELARLQAFLGYETVAAFLGELDSYLSRVARHFQALFADQPSLTAPLSSQDSAVSRIPEQPGLSGQSTVGVRGESGVGSASGGTGAAGATAAGFLHGFQPKLGNLVFTGSDHDPDTLLTLQSLGFENPEAVSELVRGWHYGRINATRSVRARELLTELIPSLLVALGAEPEPQTVLLRFDRFLSLLPAGVEFFSLLKAQPSLLTLIAEVMGTAPELAEILNHQTQLLDAMVVSGGIKNHISLKQQVSPQQIASDLTDRLEEHTQFEDQLDGVRQWAAEQRFRVGLAQLRQQLTPADSSLYYSAICDATIDYLLKAVIAEFSRNHGTIGGTAFAVLAFGKLGARSLTPASDLDLVFVFESENSAAVSDGKKPLPESVWFARLSQRLISALTTQTASGDLYQVDLRLRPDGNKGAIATQFQGFLDYYHKEAWTWELMALSRARVVTSYSFSPPAGHTSNDFSQKLTNTIAAILALPRESETLHQDIVSMREQIRTAHPPRHRFDVKYRDGGLVDIDFICQYLLLKNAAQVPALTATSETAAANSIVDLARRLLECHALSKEDAECLATVFQLFSGLQNLLRLCGGSDLRANQSILSHPSKALMRLLKGSAILQGEDFNALEEEIDRHSTAVLAISKRVFSNDNQ